MYADFEYYTVDYGGNLLTGDNFPRCANKASAFMDYYTMGKVGKAVEDAETAEKTLTAIKQCCCDLAETYAALDKADIMTAENGGEIASETVGSYSRSFRSNAETAVALKARLAEKMRMYLAGTDLLYRGVGYVCSTHCNCL